MMLQEDTKTQDPMDQFKQALSGLSQVPTPLDNADDDKPIDEDDRDVS